LFKIFATEKQAGSSRKTLYAPATAHVKNGNNYRYKHAIFTHLRLENLGEARNSASNGFLMLSLGEELVFNVNPGEE
jgi:hypothetical protein